MLQITRVQALVPQDAPVRLCARPAPQQPRALLLRPGRHARRAVRSLSAARAQGQGAAHTAEVSSSTKPDAEAVQLKDQIFAALQGYVTGPLPAEVDRLAQQLAEVSAKQPRRVTPEAVRGRFDQVANSSNFLDEERCTTLGTLTFRQFGPDVRVRLLGVTLVQGVDSPEQYQTRAEFEVVEGPHAGVRGCQVAHGTWELDPTNPVRQTVHFTGVSIEPHGDARDVSSWLALAKPANPAMDGHGVARVDFPQATNAFRDFLYYDEEVQITRGNRNSLVIVKRIE